MSGFRLPQGGAIRRDRPLSFTFNDKGYAGFEGDTLASALIAAGVDVVGRSFKYHRPRGILGLGSEEPNAIVQVGEGAHSTPNLKATTVPLHDGLIASSVNSWPSVNFDLAAINDRLRRFLPAGFYYKTFFWPRWTAYEPMIRKAAGLGHSPTLPDPDRYEHRHANCDILVVGAGPAGLAAAQASAELGLKVVLADDGPSIGGSLLWDTAAHEAGQSNPNPEEILGQGAANDRVRVITNCNIFGYYDHNQLIGVERLSGDHHQSEDGSGSGRLRERLWLIRARRVILATGAIERPMVFANNDRPGVMLASAALGYAQKFGVACGRRAVLFANNDYAYRVALELIKGGIEIPHIIDPRENHCSDVAGELAVRGVAIRLNSGIGNVIGRSRVRAIDVASLDGQSLDKATLERIPCDLLLHSAGWTPRIHLFAQSGGHSAFDARAQAFLPGGSVQNERSIGGCAGTFQIADCLAEGAAAAQEAWACIADQADPEAHAFSFEYGERQPQAGFFRSPPLNPSQKSWIDLQNDVTFSDIQLAARENYQSVEHLKRYTTLGMATDQGKTSNLNGFAAMAEARGVAINEVGVTKFRPPYEPVTLGALAGQRTGEACNPLRYLPTHSIQRGLGADFEDRGGWLRPVCYPADGETHSTAISREVLATRASVGIFEASPLGKIEVRGKDAAEFLDRIYVNTASTLKTGKARYGLMANENGVVIDDGVFFRIAPDHFLCSTTSAGAEHITEWMEEWLQCEWSQFDVHVTNVTSCWATFAIAGPQARATLEKTTEDIDISREVMPHMTYGEGSIAGVGARIARVSFTGELSFEVNIPARYADHVWSALMEAGQEFGIAPYGTEANLVMRTEKGYLHMGADTDGLTLPQDIGFARPIVSKKSDFIGRRSMIRSDAQREDRLHFVGLAVEDSRALLPVGGHIVDHDGEARRSGGYVSSSYWSPTLERAIALGRVRSGRDRTGEKVTIVDHGQTFTASIVDPRFYDRDGERLHG